MEPMDLDRSSAPTRKVRFAPKGPPRRKKAVAPKTEEDPDEADDKAAQDLLRRVKLQCTLLLVMELNLQLP